jgi:UTP--glucose-1-phosphate uridylyltransferase
MDLDPATQAILTRFRFDPETFEALRTRLRDGLAGDAQNRVRGRVTPPEPEDVTALPTPGSAAYEALAARGREAIRAGRVGAVVLAGGMATRFGGVVKAAVDALPGRSFLDLKLSELRQSAERLGGRVPVYLMTSFATDDDVTALARAHTSAAAPAETFAQFVSLRLTPEGELFREDDGRASAYAPGHGDLSFALRASGILARFRAGGGQTLFMSNVDNLAATLDPAILGAHLASGAAITAEVTEKEPGEKGGAPARVDGKPQIVEAFRFPEGFDQDAIPVFNTNTLALEADAIDRDFPLTWFAVRKKVDGREAVQFERLVGELTALLPCAFVRVPRYGVSGRFQPAKDPDELTRRRPEIEAMLRARGVL